MWYCAEKSVRKSIYFLAPNRQYCLFEVNKPYDLVPAVLYHKLTQSRHPTVQCYKKMLFFVTLRAHIIIFEFLSKTAVLNQM